MVFLGVVVPGVASAPSEGRRPARGVKRAAAAALQESTAPETPQRYVHVSACGRQPVSASWLEPTASACIAASSGPAAGRQRRHHRARTARTATTAVQLHVRRGAAHADQQPLNTTHTQVLTPRKVALSVPPPAATAPQNQTETRIPWPRARCTFIGSGHRRRGLRPQRCLRLMVLRCAVQEARVTLPRRQAPPRRVSGRDLRQWLVLQPRGVRDGRGGSSVWCSA